MEYYKSTTSVELDAGETMYIINHVDGLPFTLYGGVYDNFFTAKIISVYPDGYGETPLAVILSASDKTKMKILYLNKTSKVIEITDEQYKLYINSGSISHHELQYQYHTIYHRAA